MRRTMTVTCYAAVMLLFAAALWLRCSKLESLPEPNGDEAWHGTQAYHIAHGEPVLLQTGNGNPLNPLNTGLMAVLLKFSEPRLCILRVPPLICGVLAIILAYALGARVLDRTTALIAAGGLAVFPVAIYYARRGFDCSPTPLLGVLLVAASFRGRPKEMLLAFVGGLLCHPTNVFLLPVALPIYLVRNQAELFADRRRRRQILLGLVVTASLFLAAGLAFLNRPQVRRLQTHGFESGRPHWGVALRLDSHETLLYLRRLAVLFLGEPGSSGSTADIESGVFWTTAVAIFVVGTVQLVRQRRWDRLALVGGLAAGASSLFLVAGAAGVKPTTNRYGLFLVTPTAFAFAVLVRALMVDPTSTARRLLRSSQAAFLLMLGWGLLFCYQRNFVHVFEGNSRAQSPWALGRTVDDPRLGALRVVIRDSRRDGPAHAGRKTVILAYDWWTRWPLTYLAANLGFVEIRQLVDSAEPNDDPPDLRQYLEGGAYAVCFRGQDLEKAIAGLFPADRVLRWEIVRPGNVVPQPGASELMQRSTSVVVYRLASPGNTAPQQPSPMAAATDATRR